MTRSGARASDSTGGTRRTALGGRVVTMGSAGKVLADGVVYVEGSDLAAVLPADAPPPGGFETVRVVPTGSTLFPGLIELHNHLPYDILRLWTVPKHFTNRGQWSSPSTPDYHRLISGPMGVLGRMPDVVAAIVRYVEEGCLLGGTTTSQGVALASDPGIVTHFRGLVRNVESTGDPSLPPAATHIADIDATDAEHFLARINGTQKLILHLAEGTDDAARKHFQALRLDDGRWAITENLIGVHCAGLHPEDFDVLAAHGGSMVWSPLSNLLLYGATADLGAALAAGVPVALGSDWAPSGSKNLLGELKVARAAAEQAGVRLTGRELVAMATTTPARLLGWQARLGTLEAGKLADLIAVTGTGGDPYDALLNATEADLRLVVINGVARLGTPSLVRALTDDATIAPVGERVTVGGRKRLLNLIQSEADPTVAALSVGDAIERLHAALADLPRAGQPGARVDLRAAAAEPDGHALLAVEGVIDNHMSSRPHLPFHGRLTGPNLRSNGLRRSTQAAMATVAAPEPLPALTLDPPTAVDNPGFYDQLATEPNLPAAMRAALAALRPA